MATELCDLLLRIEGDNEYAGATGVQFVLPMVQLHHVFGTVQSPEPTQKDDDHWPSPERGQGDLLPGCARDGEVWSAVANT